jgi:hypothetical protein
VTDLLQTGQEWLADQLKEHASRQVVYQRGATELVVQATIGRTLMKLDDGYGGIRMEWTDRDFLIQAADLLIGAAVVTPERGDRVRETVGVNTSVFEVMAYGDEPPWRFSDPFGKLLRIHTKFIGIES